MSNAFTSTDAYIHAVLTAHDLSWRWKLRSRPVWRQLIDTYPDTLTNPGAPARLYLHDYLPLQTSTIDEINDPDSIALPDASVIDIDPDEYGAHVMVTLRLRDLAAQNTLERATRSVFINMQDSVDQLVMRVHDAGTNASSLENASFVLSGVTEGNIKSTDTMTSDVLANAAALLTGRLVEPKFGNMFAGVIHPFVARDIKREGITANSWSYALANAGDLADLRNAYLGEWQGHVFLETVRTRVTATGFGGAKVFTSYFLGREFAAEYPVEEPHLVQGKVGADAFNRKFAVAWYGDLGWETYRDEALQKVKTSATLQSAATVNT